jgi:hypothetical protein
MGTSPRRLALRICVAVTWSSLGMLACTAARPAAPKTVAAAPVSRSVTIDDLMPETADVEVTLHPPALARDRVYGPLLRRASTLAAAYAGPRSLGTTALTALERSEEVDVAMNDAGQAVIVLLGVPGDLDVAKVVDEDGQPVWRPAAGDVRESFVEYEPIREATASLFVLRQRVWVMAAGAARSKTREALVEAQGGGLSFAPGKPSLVDLTIRGAALLRRDDRLRAGLLAPLGRSLLRASFELTPGALGVIVARLEYADGVAATGAEQTARDVVSAFRRKLEQIEKGPDGPPRPGVGLHPELPSLSWLAAAGVEREETTVSVRAPIPKVWLDAIAQADVAGSAPSSPGGVSPNDVPWSLWRRTTPAPTLTLPR